MAETIFEELKKYFENTFHSVHSVFRSFWASTPYWFNSSEWHKEVTEQYPDPISSRSPDDLPARSRGLLFNEIEKCTGCKECEKVCPTQAIHIENEDGFDPTKPWVAVYDIDFARCVFCGLCAYSCEPQSLYHTKQYEGSVYRSKDLVTSFGRGHVTQDQKSKWAALKKQNDFEGVLA